MRKIVAETDIESVRFSPNSKQMCKRAKLILVLGAVCLCAGQASCLRGGTSYCPLTQWVDTLKGDFGFATRWSYPEGIFRNPFGQLDCDGLCPEAVERMRDSRGRIHTDSLHRFYLLVDTTRRYHSLACEAQCYEWGGSRFAAATQFGEDSTVCATEMNAATHCRLVIVIRNEAAAPRIELNSVSSAAETTVYRCKSGFIRIDRNAWNKGFLKAEFDYLFDNTDQPDQPLLWRGRIYTPIEKKSIR